MLMLVGAMEIKCVCVCGSVCVHMCLNLPPGELEVVKLKFPEVLKDYEN